MIRNEKEYPIPRLPQLLTEDGLRNLMRERAYWDLKHPSSPLYQRLVAQGFAFLFPGKTKYDEPGKAIDVSPLPPEAVAHQVAQVNREMDRLERSLAGTSIVAQEKHDEENRQPFDERPTSRREGAVHVQSHTRDGGKTEVADYWRAKPGQGNEDDTRGGTNNDGADRAEPISNRDTDDAEAVQAGNDDERLPSRDAQVVPNPEKMVREWTGTWRGRGTEKFECVGLVKEAIPEIGHTSTWRESDKIIEPGNPPLEPGTAIATFSDGKYLNKSGESHAAIFLGYDTKDGQDGIRVFDQFRGSRGARERFIPFNRPDKTPVNRAESFSVIKKGN